MFIKLLNYKSMNNNNNLALDSFRCNLTRETIDRVGAFIAREMVLRSIHLHSNMEVLFIGKIINIPNVQEAKMGPAFEGHNVVTMRARKFAEKLMPTIELLL
ncbi:hypothetical protein GOP47_0018068 [Adiantum capillus-veneris]|uniref:Uncharacterized protein n=1 Tax=Adiantum capillus-veneris TaxID=13818 RepID=A0A9D4ZBH2_ADICA|nr:hypothetical protein GOP47_0018068 [Adiantum capillus-veneris]